MFRLLTLYWRSILGAFIALLFIAAGAAGYYYTKQMQQEAYLKNASYAYEQLVEEIQQNTTQSTLDKVTHFTQKYTNSPYPALLHLQVAKQAIDENQLPKAFEWLQSAAEQAKEPEIRSIAIQRGARVLVAMNQPEKALALLDTIQEEAYLSQAEELKGDIFNALKDKVNAKKAYQKAAESDASITALQPLLPLKLNELDHLEIPLAS